MLCDGLHRDINIAQIFKNRYPNQGIDTYKKTWNPLCYKQMNELLSLVNSTSGINVNNEIKFNLSSIIIDLFD